MTLRTLVTWTRSQEHEHEHGFGHLDVTWPKLQINDLKQTFAVILSDTTFKCDFDDLTLAGTDFILVTP